MNAPTYQRLAEWIGLGARKPASAELAAYLKSELDNAEEIDAVDAAVAREAVKALNAYDDMREALKLARTMLLSLNGGHPKDKAPEGFRDKLAEGVFATVDSAIAKAMGD